MELAIIGARKNICCILQWRITHEQKRRRNRCVLMNYLILKQRQKQKLLLHLCFTLVKTCRVEKGRRKIRCHCFEQNIGWFQNVRNTYNDARFKACFGISRETFEFISNNIKHLRSSVFKPEKKQFLKILKIYL